MPQYYERSCDNCRRLKIRCDRVKPHCKNCNKRDICCTRNKPLQKRGPKPKPFKNNKKLSKRSNTLTSPTLDSFESDELSHVYELTSNHPYDVDMLDYSEYSEDEESLTCSESSYQSSSKELLNEVEDEGDEEAEMENDNLSTTANMMPLFNPIVVENYKQKQKMILLEEMLKNVDYKKMMEETLKKDDELFKSKLSKLMPTLLDQQQYDYVLYYFDNVHSHIPLISSERFITLIQLSIENNTTQIIKNLISIICQISYHFANKPTKFRNSILTFLLLCNLDSITNTPKNSATMPYLLINAYTMLINYHCSVTNF